jgi:hypothetical protein
MAEYRKYLRMAIVAGLALMFFSPVFPFALEKKVISVALAKKKTSKKIANKPKKKKIEKNQTFVFQIKIVGGPDCVKNTNHALSILQQKSSGDLEKVLENIGIVECVADGSGVFVWENPVRFKVGLATYQADELWYASALIHESCHAERYKKYSFSHPGEPVPPEIFSGAEAESQCLFEQYNCLSRLDAEQPFLDYTKKIAKTYYWDIPYEKRWW